MKITPNNPALVSPMVAAVAPDPKKNARDLLSKGTEVASSVISVATGVVSSPLLSLASGQGATSGGSQNGSNDLNSMKSLQDQNQKFSMDYLKIQMQMQEENRRFSTLSNISKAKHDTAKAAIQNIRT